MTRYRFIVATLPLMVGGLSGCTTLMQGAPLPEGFAVKELAKADAGKPFAINRDGAIAAISKGAITVIPPEGEGRNIAEGTATALSFSPNGERLVAALPAGKTTVLRIFDRQGKVLAETAIPETVTSIAWRSERQVLATALTVKKFTFGSELISHLYMWDGATPPAATTLADVTVRAPLAKQTEETLSKSLYLAVSPYGDEIAYSSLKDPPVFTPYLRIAVRHLESGAEREVGKTSVGSAGLIYAPDGESLLIGDAQSLTRRLAVGDGREMDAWPTPGSHPAFSPSGSYVFLDGRLYRDGRTVTSFPPKSRVAFLPDGSGLAVSYDGKLYTVSGLKDQAPASLPADLERLLKLRRLRSLGLITEKEYRSQKEKATAQ